MTDRKVLVLGGTGPAGICLLRELVHRNHATIVFARNPSKIPEELAQNSLVEVCCFVLSPISPADGSVLVIMLTAVTQDCQRRDERQPCFVNGNGA